MGRTTQNVTRFYQGTMVNADAPQGVGYEGWVSINWLYPGEKKVTAIKDLKRIEARIRGAGLKGWLCSSEREHTIMHNIILPKLGAIKYSEDDKNLYFKREVA